jgi:hypothetical protein
MLWEEMPMNDFDDCSEEELEALQSLAEDSDFSKIKPEIIQSLVEKYLIEEYEGNYIIPALVWYRWQKFQQK